MNTDAQDAALWRAARDMARIRGQVVLIDRIDSAMVAVGGERQTSEGRTLDDALGLAARRMGIDAGTRARAAMPTMPDLTRLHCPLPDSEDGGLDP